MKNIINFDKERYFKSRNLVSYSHESGMRKRYINNTECFNYYKYSQHRNKDKQDFFIKVIHFTFYIYILHFTK